jgi:hypothetical protein
VKRVEEEKMRKKEDLIKDSGVEMVEKHFVWSRDIPGREMGPLSVNIEFEKEKEANCSSSAALLGDFNKQAPEPKAEEKEEKKEEDGIPVCGGMSTTSLTFLVDGLSCVEPFEKEIVDHRDTILSFILSKENHVHYSERRRWIIEMCSKIIPLVLHILSMGEYGCEWLI